MNPDDPRSSPDPAFDVVIREITANPDVPYIVSRDGRPAAVILSPALYEEITGRNLTGRS